MAHIEGVNGHREEFRVVGKPNISVRLSNAIATGLAEYFAEYHSKHDRQMGRSAGHTGQGPQGS